MKTAGRITLVLFGQPFWTNRLAASVARQPTRLSIIDLGGRGVRAIAHLAAARLSGSVVALRVGYRPGAPTPRGRGFDVLWHALRRLRTDMKTGYFWIGSDVSSAAADHAIGQLTGSYAVARDSSAHCAGAPWLCAELATTGVDAAYVPFPVHVPSLPVPTFPTRFTALTYIPDGRPHLYGGDCLLATAAAMPDVPFVVAGGDGTWTSSAPGNVSFVGRIPSLIPAMTASHAVLRLVRHDGFGATVREALALGRYALYSYDVPGAIAVDVDRVETVVGPLHDLRDRHRRGDLVPNREGRRYVIEELNEASTVARFESWVGDVAAGAA